MRWRTPGRPRELIAAFVILVLVAAVTVYAWPSVLRHLLVAQIQSLTQRPVTIEAAGFNPFTGRLVVRGFRLGAGRPDPLRRLRLARAPLPPPPSCSAISGSEKRGSTARPSASSAWPTRSTSRISSTGRERRAGTRCHGRSPGRHRDRHARGPGPRRGAHVDARSTSRSRRTTSPRAGTTARPWAPP